jgi:GTP-binding protein
MSAVTGAGVASVVASLTTLVSEARRGAAVASGGLVHPDVHSVVHRPAPEGVVVERGDDGVFVVRGRAAERAVAVNDLTNDDALAYVQHRLKRLGVDRALARAGAREGDLVHVGGFTFTYEPG